MRKVKFIESLNIREVPCLNNEEVRYRYFKDTPVTYVEDDVFLDTADENFEVCEEERIVPVHKLWKPKQRGHDASPFDPASERYDVTYIAYSKEVQELLEVNFDALKNSNEILEVINENLGIELGGYKQATFWQRLKYLFGSKL